VPPEHAEAVFVADTAAVHPFAGPNRLTAEPPDEADPPPLTASNPPPVETHGWLGPVVADPTTATATALFPQLEAESSTLTAVTGAAGACWAGMPSAHSTVVALDPTAMSTKPQLHDECISPRDATPQFHVDPRGAIAHRLPHAEPPVDTPQYQPEPAPFPTDTPK
jgi:hypothetical protein